MMLCGPRPSGQTVYAQPDFVSPIVAREKSRGIKKARFNKCRRKYILRRNLVSLGGDKGCAKKAFSMIQFCTGCRRRRKHWVVTSVELSPKGEDIVFQRASRFVVDKSSKPATKWRSKQKLMYLRTLLIFWPGFIAFVSRRLRLVHSCNDSRGTQKKVQ